MGNRTLNFDNFMTEQKQEPILVTVFGKEYPVKPEVPAIVMVTLARANENEATEADVAMMMINAADRLFGKKAVDEMCSKGISTEQLGQLIRMVFETINGRDVDGDDPEEQTDEDGMVSPENRAKK